jgi:hypothetical protein
LVSFEFIYSFFFVGDDMDQIGRTYFKLFTYFSNSSTLMRIQEKGLKDISSLKSLSKEAFKEFKSDRYQDFLSSSFYKGEGLAVQEELLYRASIKPPFWQNCASGPLKNTIAKVFQ